MMRSLTSRLPLVALVVVAGIAACSDDDNTSPPPTNPQDSGVVDSSNPTDAAQDQDTGATGCANTLNFAPGQEQMLQDAVNSLTGCATITLAAGTYVFTNAITIRQPNVTFKGAGKGKQGEATAMGQSTVLDFTTAAANTNGVDAVGDGFAISDLAIWNAKKDSLRVETSKNVKIQRVRAEWLAQNSTDNGAYGIYPVSSENVLVEDCEAYNASDAGIYVGQTKTSIVRNNTAKQNVAGIEIENCQFADVYGNTAEDNTGGLVAFDLPGNPTPGTDIRIHDNTVKSNNRANFGSGSSTVSQIPAGTGTFIMASRRVELFGNTWAGNNTTDVAIISGLSLESDTSKWPALNFGTKDIWIHDNTFDTGSGLHVDNDMPDQTNRPLGALVAGLYAYGEQAKGITRVEPVIWDGVDPAGADDLLNQINLCVKTNSLPAGTQYATADLNFVGAQTVLAADSTAIDQAWAKGARYQADAAPFDCAGLTTPITPVTLP